MKQLIKLLILVLVAIPFGVAHAQKKTTAVAAESKEALAVVQAKSIKESLSKNTLEPKEVTAAYDGISQLVLNRNGVPMKDMMELCLLYTKHDQSNAVFAFVATLKDSNPKEFEKALRMLSKANAKKIEDIVELAE